MAEAAQVTAWDLLIELSEACGGFRAKSMPRLATKTEFRRWFQEKQIMIDGKRVPHDHVITFPVRSFVLFPKGDRVTLW